MGAALVEVSEFTAVVPSIENSEAANGTTFTTPLQALANRTRFHENRLTAGVQRAQAFADAAALRLVATHTTGSIAALASGQVFIFNPFSGAADDGVLVVKPTDVASGAGRWINPAYYLLAGAASFEGIVSAAAFSSPGTCQFGLTQADSIECSGALSAGPCTLGATTTAALTASGLVTAQNGLTVEGADLACTLNARVQGDFIVDGSTTLNSNCSINGGLTVAGTILGRTRVVAGANSPGTTTYQANVVSEVIIEGLSADRAYAVSNTGAAEGMKMRFTTHDPTHTATVSLPTGSTFPLVYTVGEFTTVDLIFLGGIWQVSLLVRRTV